MSRVQDLRKLFNGVDKGKMEIVNNLIDEAVFLEKQLVELRKQPFIKIHPKNPNLQKITAAGKLYKDILAQYKDVIRYLTSVYGKEDGAEESPLRAFTNKLLEELKEKEKKR